MPIVFSTPLNSADYQVLARRPSTLRTGLCGSPRSRERLHAQLCADPISATVTYIAIVDASMTLISYASLRRMCSPMGDVQTPSVAKRP
jgi:hypothetical protein